MISWFLRPEQSSSKDVKSKQDILAYFFRQKFLFWYSDPQSTVHVSSDTQRPFQVHKVKDFFYNTTESLFALFAVFISPEYHGVFQRLCIWYHNKLEADTKYNYFLFFKLLLFFMKITYLLTYKGFQIILNNHKYILVLIFHVLNITRYNPHKHKHFAVVQSLSCVWLFFILMDYSPPGFPVLHHLLEFAQTHVHWVSDAIQPSHPLLSPSPAVSLSQNRGLFQGVGSSYQVAKVSELQHQSFQWIFRTNFL